MDIILGYIKEYYVSGMVTSFAIWLNFMFFDARRPQARRVFRDIACLDMSDGVVRFILSIIFAFIWPISILTGGMLTIISLVTTILINTDIIDDPFTTRAAISEYDIRDVMRTEARRVMNEVGSDMAAKMQRFNDHIIKTVETAAPQIISLEKSDDRRALDL